MAEEETKLSVDDVRLCHAAARWQVKLLKAAFAMIEPRQINECGSVDDVSLPALAHAVAHTGQPLFHTDPLIADQETMNARQRQLDCMALLIQAGADPNARGDDDACAIHFALSKSVVTSLLLAKANIDAQDSNGMTALMLRMFENDESMVEHLIRCGADGNLENNDGEKACDIERYDGTDEPGLSELQEYLRKDLRDKLKYLMTGFVDAFSMNLVVAYIVHDPTKIASAAAACDLVTVTRLIAANPCDVKRTILLKGWTATPLGFAVKRGGRLDDPADNDENQFTVVQRLLEAKSDPNALDCQSLPPLAWARTARIATALIDARAHVNFEQFALRKDTISTLQRAAYLGRRDVVRVLLERGADPFSEEHAPLAANAYLVRRMRQHNAWIREFDEKPWERDYTAECFVQIRAALIQQLFRVLAPYLTKDAASVVIPYCLDAICAFTWQARTGHHFEPIVVHSVSSFDAGQLFAPVVRVGLRIAS